MMIIGLTGGVASGKSFVQDILRWDKIPVFDADYEVHQLIAENKKVILAIKKSFPSSIVNDKIDRKLLGLEVFGNKEKLAKLEQIIYPSLHKKEAEFIKENKRKKAKFVVLNIPLLLEKKRYQNCDKVIAILASKQIRFERFKKRFKNENLLEVKKRFNQIISNQTTDLQRKSKADFLIYNSSSKAFCTRQIKSIIKTICNLQNPVL